MQSRRDYLVGLGLAKPGRGKFSNDAKEALRKAEASGTKFSDTAPSTGFSGTRSVAPKTEPTEPKPVDPRDSAYILPSDYRFPEAEYKAVGVKDGKTYGLREVCNKCRVSLVMHVCNEPVIHGNISVHIRKK